MEAQAATKKSRFLEVLALLCFLVVGFIASCPLLAPGGEAAGYFKEAFFILVFARLVWTVYKRSFNWMAYLIYFAFVLGFCSFVDSRF